MPEEVKAHIRSDKIKMTDEAIIQALNQRRLGATMNDAAAFAGIKPTMLVYIERGMRLTVTNDDVMRAACTMNNVPFKK